MFTTFFTIFFFVDFYISGYFTDIFRERVLRTFSGFRYTDIFYEFLLTTDFDLSLFDFWLFDCLLNDLFLTYYFFYKFLLVDLGKTYYFFYSARFGLFYFSISSIGLAGFALGFVTFFFGSASLKARRRYFNELITLSVSEGSRSSMPESFCYKVSTSRILCLGLNWKQG